MITTDQIKEWGIVGAGGAGFPTHVKLSAKAGTFIVNAAECEPLLHKDKEILLHHSKLFFTGLRTCMQLIGAQHAIIGIKGKYQELIDLLQPYCTKDITIFPLRNFYPAGDEISLIYETTGRAVAAGQLPITQDVVVQNVETIYNIGRQQPVTTSFLTVGGAVAKTMSVEVPIGVSYRQVLSWAEPLVENYAVIAGGPMMGKLCTDLDQPVVKSSGGLLVFPKDHQLIQRHQIMGDEKAVAKIGRAACDQCSICTELCPRSLLGHPVKPHLAMRNLIFSDGVFKADQSMTHTLSCCECNLCTLMACPEGLYPSQSCIYNKRQLSQAKITHQGGGEQGVHPLISYRRMPMEKVMSRLDLNRFVNKGPLMDIPEEITKVRVPLQQHIGAPCQPLVKQGDRVEAGQKIATCSTNLGAEIHASIAGEVVMVDQVAVTIEKKAELAQ
ncbi:4Fe-4S dicluster domain-containing protein [Desulfogranum japonicum]|uniref:4Fe-4S dicluster domain-containing protein n=1 Tax=Desulfogranum japonicum TaxID=231447 RepID=UPI000400A45F|nr:4Fe-4S dicluster domain-containing protein [Desulfogranum japonicum]